jgi:hypothetical protein
MITRLTSEEGVEVEEAGTAEAIEEAEVKGGQEVTAAAEDVMITMTADVAIPLKDSAAVKNVVLM